MNKELTPLEALQEYKMIKNYFDRKAHEKIQTLRVFNNEDELYSIIETALKEYERLKKLYKLEEETSKHLNKTVLLMNEEINKQLKAFEIIVKKEVNIEFWLSFNVGVMTYKEYTNLNKILVITSINKEVLTQEEFDLLKEILE